MKISKKRLVMYLALLVAICTIKSDLKDEIYSFTFPENFDLFKFPQKLTEDLTFMSISNNFLDNLENIKLFSLWVKKFLKTISSEGLKPKPVDVAQTAVNSLKYCRNMNLDSDFEYDCGLKVNLIKLQWKYAMTDWLVESKDSIDVGTLEANYIKFSEDFWKKFDKLKNMKEYLGKNLIDEKFEKEVKAFLPRDPKLTDDQKKTLTYLIKFPRYWYEQVVRSIVAIENDPEFSKSATDKNKWAKYLEIINNGIQAELSIPEMKEDDPTLILFSDLSKNLIIEICKTNPKPTTSLFKFYLKVFGDICTVLLNSGKQNLVEKLFKNYVDSLKKINDYELNIHIYWFENFDEKKQGSMLHNKPIRVLDKSLISNVVNEKIKKHFNCIGNNLKDTATYYFIYIRSCFITDNNKENFQTFDSRIKNLFISYLEFFKPDFESAQLILDAFFPWVFEYIKKQNYVSIVLKIKELGEIIATNFALTDNPKKDIELSAFVLQLYILGSYKEKYFLKYLDEKKGFADFIFLNVVKELNNCNCLVKMNQSNEKSMILEKQKDLSIESKISSGTKKQDPLILTDNVNILKLIINKFEDLLDKQFKENPDKTIFFNLLKEALMIICMDKTETVVSNEKSLPNPIKKPEDSSKAVLNQKSNVRLPVSKKPSKNEGKTKKEQI